MSLGCSSVAFFIINSVREESVVPVRMTCFASFHTSEYELIPDHSLQWPAK